MADTSLKRIRNISFTITAAEQVANRMSNRNDNASGITSEMIERYAMLLTRGRATARSLFEPAELTVLTEICHGITFDANTLYYGLEMNARDRITHDLEQKWGVTKAGIVNKLAEASPDVRAAIIEAIERHWLRVGQGETPDSNDILNY